MRALHTAATGMMAQELNVQVISNNIANMRTTGYKRQRAEFQDLLYEHVRRVGTQTSDQGNILPVGIDLGARRQDRRHAAPDDAGHARADRQATRRRHPRRRLLQDPHAGRHLRLHARRLVRARRAGPHRHAATATCVQPGITIPQNATGVTINAQGQVSGDAARPDHADACSARSSSRRFVNKAGLQAIGDNLFSKRRPPARRRTASRTSDGFGNLQQGNLEQANVEAVTEISDLIAAQRAYEMNAKVITATDQMLQSTSQMLR